MRPIDADVLLYNTDGLEHVKWSQEYGHVVLVCDIVYSPTLDVQEVKHGEWIIDENDPERDTQCSICGFVLDNWIQGALYSFCPNCGAKMERSEE